MQEMNSSTLATQSMKQLKYYINCYNLPAQHALEKDDLVKLIFNTRPLTNQNERHYRMLRDRQYTTQSNRTMTPSNEGMDFFDDNPITSAINKISEIFITEPSPQQTSSHRQQTTSSQTQYTNASSSYPSYIYQDTPLRSSSPSNQQRRPASIPPQQQQQRPASNPPQQQQRPASNPPQQQQQRPASNPPQPERSTSPPSPTVTLQQILSQSIDPSTLSVRTLKTILRSSHVELNFALEKKELVNRVQQLIEDEKKLKKDNDDDDEHVCRICYDAQQNCVFLNCGHMATCIDCGLKLVEAKNECPICRDLIVRVVRVFRS
ncbi:hypothetical protein BC941DRAFT_422991 [Chlamydoabsidia padenii]|nr:hypothetical protein BC941DRAFT_422991 [Chlamydoabsidia padenii]